MLKQEAHPQASIEIHRELEAQATRLADRIYRGNNFASLQYCLSQNLNAPPMMQAVQMTLSDPLVDAAFIRYRDAQESVVTSDPELTFHLHGFSKMLRCIEHKELVEGKKTVIDFLKAHVGVTTYLTDHLADLLMFARRLYQCHLKGADLRNDAMRRLLQHKSVLQHFCRKGAVLAFDNWCVLPQNKEFYALVMRVRQKLEISMLDDMWLMMLEYDTDRIELNYELQNKFNPTHRVLLTIESQCLDKLASAWLATHSADDEKQSPSEPCVLPVAEKHSIVLTPAKHKLIEAATYPPLKYNLVYTPEDLQARVRFDTGVPLVEVRLPAYNQKVYATYRDDNSVPENLRQKIRDVKVGADAQLRSLEQWCLSYYSLTHSGMTVRREENKKPSVWQIRRGERLVYELKSQKALFHAVNELAELPLPLAEQLVRYVRLGFSSERVIYKWDNDTQPALRIYYSCHGVEQEIHDNDKDPFCSKLVKMAKQCGDRMTEIDITAAVEVYTDNIRVLMQISQILQEYLQFKKQGYLLDVSPATEMQTTCTIMIQHKDNPDGNYQQFVNQEMVEVGELILAYKQDGDSPEKFANLLRAYQVIVNLMIEQMQSVRVSPGADRQLIISREGCESERVIGEESEQLGNLCRQYHTAMESQRDSLVKRAEMLKIQLLISNIEQRAICQIHLGGENPHIRLTFRGKQNTALVIDSQHPLYWVVKQCQMKPRSEWRLEVLFGHLAERVCALRQRLSAYTFFHHNPQSECGKKLGEKNQVNGAVYLDSVDARPVSVKW